jgi:hypothetical protein
MGFFFALASLTVSACYATDFITCARCSSDNQCPGNQSCEQGICHGPGGESCSSSAKDASAADVPMPVACTGLVAPTGCTIADCGTACYAVCPQLKTYDQSVSDCAAAGWCSASIASPDENACLSTATASASFAPWVGLMQAATATAPDLLWSWTCTPPTSYISWAPGQPDDSDGVENGQENCAAFGMSSLGDAPCADKHPFVCVHRPV